ncbi:hypothetical protein GQR58_030419 [Nymphon striatum]|nr:hypothetical protein GQR58_030419 [Nymphon striatum]
MSRDYKPKTKKNKQWPPFFIRVTIWLFTRRYHCRCFYHLPQRGSSPFEDTKANAPTTKALPDETSKETNPDAKKPEPSKGDDLDFYTILPETESTVSVKEINDADIIVKKEKADADNLKAKLALQGFEAIVQTASIPEKGTWHRVRVGPLNNIKSINKVRGDLTANNFNADLIKISKD